MAQTDDFDEIVLKQLREGADFRRAMLEEISEAIASEEPELGGSLLREVASAAGGFAAVGERIGASAQAVERMLSPERGAPNTKDLLRILACLQEREGVRFDAAGIYCRRGERRRDKGELDAAIADFDEAIRLNPKHNAAVRHRAAAVALRDGKAEQSAPAHRLHLAAAK